MNFNKPVDSFYNESSIKRWLKKTFHESEIDIKANGTQWFAASHKFDTQFLVKKEKPCKVHYRVCYLMVF